HPLRRSARRRPAGVRCRGLRSLGNPAAWATGPRDARRAQPERLGGANERARRSVPEFTRSRTRRSVSADERTGAVQIPDSEYSGRIEALRAAASERGLDAVLVYGAHRDYRPADLRYLARWYCIEEETACLVVPTSGSTTLITDASWDLDRAADEAFADDFRLSKDLGTTAGELIARDAGSRPRVGIAGFSIFPAPVYFALGDALPGAVFEDASELTEERRIIRSPAELGLMRAASRISDEAMAAGLAEIEEGKTEIDAASAAEAVIRRAGAEPSFATEMGAGPRTALGTFLPGE